MVDFFNDYEKIQKAELPEQLEEPQTDAEPKEDGNSSQNVETNEQNLELIKLVKELKTQVNELQNELSKNKEGEILNNDNSADL